MARPADHQAALTVQHYQYLLLLAACLAITAPLECFGAGIYRRIGRAAAAIIPVAIVFIGWDVLAVMGGVWTYNPRYVTGWHVGVIPVEELLFFLVIPLCGLLTFSAVSTIVARLTRRRADRGVNR